MARLSISMLRIGLFDYLFYFISDDIPFMIFHTPSSHTSTVSVIMIIEGISSFRLTSTVDLSVFKGFERNPYKFLRNIGQKMHENLELF